MNTIIYHLKKFAPLPPHASGTRCHQVFCCEQLFFCNKKTFRKPFFWFGKNHTEFQNQIIFLFGGNNKITPNSKIKSSFFWGGTTKSHQIPKSNHLFLGGNNKITPNSKIKSPFFAKLEKKKRCHLGRNPSAPDGFRPFFLVPGKEGVGKKFYLLLKLLDYS